MRDGGAGQRAGRGALPIVENDERRRARDDPLRVVQILEDALEASSALETGTKFCHVEVQLVGHPGQGGIGPVVGPPFRLGMQPFMHLPVLTLVARAFGGDGRDGRVFVHA